MDMDDYIKKVNKEIFILVQIESPKALSQVDQIAKVKGIDGLFFGPGDFTVLSGIPGQFDSVIVQSAIKKVYEAAKKNGKEFGTLVFNKKQGCIDFTYIMIHSTCSY